MCEPPFFPRRLLWESRVLPTLPAGMLPRVLHLPGLAGGIVWLFVSDNVPRTAIYGTHFDDSG